MTWNNSCIFLYFLFIYCLRYHTFFTWHSIIPFFVERNDIRDEEGWVTIELDAIRTHGKTATTVHDIPSGYFLF